MKADEAIRKTSTLSLTMTLTRTLTKTATFDVDPTLDLAR